jgi:hypothetical protein
MIDEQPRTLGLSGDLGWSDDDESAPLGVGTVALMLGHGTYWMSVWLLAGLLPLPLLAIRSWWNGGRV